eukprot:SAG25_NODE_835_length_5135_cov_3.455719_6_plen_94_part_00
MRPPRQRLLASALAAAGAAAGQQLYDDKPHQLYSQIRTLIPSQPLAVRATSRRLLQDPTDIRYDDDAGALNVILHILPPPAPRYSRTGRRACE